MAKQVVKVTAAQAKALEDVKAKHSSISRTLEIHADYCWDGEYEPLNDFSMETLATALIVGYEEEKSPEEKVLEYHTSVSRKLITFNYSTFSGEKRGIEEVLKLLGITIKGINDK